MGILSNMRLLNGERLQKSAKATVQTSGKLTFTTGAGELLKLSAAGGSVNALYVFAGENNDLAMVPADEEDSRSFMVRSAGGTHYLSFQNYLRESGIDYKKQKVSYDITQLDEEYDGRPVYRFEFRVRPRGEEAGAAEEASGAAEAGGGVPEEVRAMRDEVDKPCGEEGLRE